MMYTIKDLAEGRVAVINDGDLENLKKVIRMAFPKDNDPPTGSDLFYFKGDFGAGWLSNGSFTSKPSQSVKDFLKQIEEPWVPKRGDRVLVSDEGFGWMERYFLTEIVGAVYPYVVVSSNFEENFEKDEKDFTTSCFKKIKPIPTPQPQTELTMEEIAEKFGINVNNLKIVK